MDRAAVTEADVLDACQAACEAVSRAAERALDFYGKDGKKFAMAALRQSQDVLAFQIAMVRDSDAARAHATVNYPTLIEFADREIGPEWARQYALQNETMAYWKSAPEEGTS